MQIYTDGSYKPDAMEQIILNYLIPEEKYQRIFVEIQIDTHRRNEMITIPDLRDRFIKTVQIVHQLSPEDDATFVRRTSKRFNSLTKWVVNGGHKVPENTEFPFTENE